ncbi:hypothetical protein DKM19_32760 [Streptosporangium sp. 'caverna']|nr:hypothetical protein DKM19_32760 [Streptosporangium sp. 'caverna']
MGVAALTVGGLALGGPWLRGDSSEQGAGAGEANAASAASAAPSAPPKAVGGGPVAAGELEKKDEAAGSSKGADKKRQASEDEAAGPSKHTDKEAVAYFESRKETKRVKDIRIVGGYLRIYTDLPDSASNSKQAIKLCEAGRDYLVGELGKPNPVVFVQAEFGENGNPVLANILGPDDSDCRVTHPEPGK